MVAEVELRTTTRPMTTGDLPDLARWLAAEHVRRWWPTRDVSRRAVRATYLPRLEGRSRIRMWVVEVNGRSIGLMQDYLIGDHPQFALLAPDPRAVGIDYAIGEPAWVGRGLGTPMVRSWLLGPLRSGYPDAAACFAAPDHRNTASRRVLEKAGFTAGTWFDEPRADGSVSTMVGYTLDLLTARG